MLTIHQIADLSQDTQFDSKVLGGSLKRKIVNPALIEERARCTFDREEAFRVAFPADQREEFTVYDTLIKKYPRLASGFEYYEMSREEKMTVWWDRFKVIMADEQFRHLITGNSHKKCKYWNWFYMFPGTNPMTLHMLVFTKTLLGLCSEEQLQSILPKANNWNIIGCYAQTELGHGSNVAGL